MAFGSSQAVAEWRLALRSARMRKQISEYLTIPTPSESLTTLCRNMTRPEIVADSASGLLSGINGSDRAHSAPVTTGSITWKVSETLRHSANRNVNLLN